MRVYLCGDTAHDPGLKGEQGHAEGEPRKERGLQKGRAGVSWDGILYDQYVKHVLNMIREIKGL